MLIQPRQYQRECNDAFYRYYQEGNGGHGLIVVPTAGGKSLIIGTLTTEICQRWPSQRILILSHVQELIEQNHAKILACWKNAPAGIYSAGIGKRQAHHPIVVASIQSVYSKALILGHRDLVFIDEAHLLQFGNAGMYHTLLKGLTEINPNLKVCGFTATDYRVDGGPLTEGEGKLFDDVIIDIPIQRLLDEGYITPPIGKYSSVQADLRGVKTVAGEFNTKQMAERFTQDEFIARALDSDMEFFEGRNSIALFCATIENAELVAQGMCARGIYCEVLEGTMSAADRRDKLERFRSGKLRALASVGVITTGTDIPGIDCLVVLRAMKSPGLYQQIVGRGFRVVYMIDYPIDTVEQRRASIAAGPKPNFLVLDHGGNIMRHGPITAVCKPQAREKGKRAPAEKAKIRVCEICRTANTLEAITCITCGTQLKRELDPTSNLDVEASAADILGTPFSRGEAPEWFKVDNVLYRLHQRKADGAESMRVTYCCGLMEFDEWKKPGNSVVRWCNNRGVFTSPSSVAHLIKLSASFKKPSRVQVIKREKNFDVLRYDFTTEEKLYDGPIHESRTA